MLACKPCPTPQAQDVSGPGESICTADALVYKEGIVSLLYLSKHTRPDISAAGNTFVRYIDAPSTVKWSVAWRVMRYLRETLNYGI